MLLYVMLIAGWHGTSLATKHLPPYIVLPANMNKINILRSVGGLGTSNL